MAYERGGAAASSAAAPTSEEDSLFIDLLHEAPLSGHREPRSIVGGTLYCILLAGYAAVAISAPWIFLFAPDMIPPLLCSSNVVLLVLTGIFQQYWVHQVRKVRLQGYYDFSQKLKHIARLPFATIACGTALMLLIMVWQPLVHILSVSLLLRIAIVVEVTCTGCFMILYIWHIHKYNSLDGRPDILRSLYSALQPSSTLEDRRYYDGRLSDQQMALLQYQRENIHYLSEEVLRLQECLSKYQRTDAGIGPQVDLAHLLASRDQELRALTAEMNQVHSELQLARGLIDEKDSEIQRIRVSNNQYVEENDRLRAILGEWSARAAKLERALEAERVSNIELRKNVVPLGNAAGVRAATELVGRVSVSLAGGGAPGMTSCHQCRKVGNVIWCNSCDRRGYCAGCISRWYSDIPIDDVQKVCPACRGICNCRVCLQGDNLIKARVQEISVVDKLRYLHSLLVYVLPVLKQIYSDQCFEIGVETRSSGPKTDILRAKINSDEQMCCDSCKVPVFDYHRHCPKCLYDLCLDCCRDIRCSRANFSRVEYTEGNIEDRSKDSFSKRARLEPSAENAHDKSFSQPTDLNKIDIKSLYPTWRVNNDGSITCGPHEAGGCGSSKLVLRRIFKINWIAKLVKSSEEMVNGCKVHDLENECLSCNDDSGLESTGQRNFCLSKCLNSDGLGGNRVYSPVLEDLKYEGIIHFRKHWIKGEPIIIRKAFEPSLSSSWDPLSIWRGIQEIMDEQMDEDIKVKAVDFSNQSEVDIELKQFIKGYSDGNKGGYGRLLMLKLKEWPQRSVLEEFLLCQRPEFIVNFPLVDFIHPRWGLLNLAAKLPPDALQPEVGMKLLVAYGSRQELGKGDSVTNLMVNMGDVVHMLMHTAEVHNPCPQSLQLEQSERIANGASVHVNDHPSVQNMNPDVGEQVPQKSTPKSNEKGHVPGLRLQERFLDVNVYIGSEGSSTELSSPSHCEEPKTNSSEGSLSGALWDVFRRHDLPKLNEYLAANRGELAASSQTVTSVKHPIYNQDVYLNNYDKKILKGQYGIEPWTFHQHIGEAVFIPAGCPFQVKNLQSTVQLALNFSSPESLPESVRMAHEIRCMPNGHDAKMKMLEIGKISLYAASSAVREIQRLTLDPKFNLDVRFEDQNLTRAVSENLARVINRREIDMPFRIEANLK